MRYVLFAPLAVLFLSACASHQFDDDPSTRADVAPDGASIANGTDETRLTSIAAVDPERVPQVVAEIERKGGSILQRFDSVGYLRIQIEESQTSSLLAIPGVQAIERGQPSISGNCFGVGRGSGNDAGTVEAPQDPLPATAFEAYSPFNPLGDMGLQAFREDHPTYDGRGVTVGVLEGCSNSVTDFSNPAFSEAIDLTGRPIEKFAGIIDPHLLEPVSAEGLDPPWRIVPQGLLQTNDTGNIVLDGTQYRAPALGAWLGGFYHRGAGQSFAVIWRQNSDQVWIDSNANGRLDDEVPISDFNRRFDFTHLEFEDEGAAARRVPIAAVFDTRNQSVFLYEGTNSHQTMTAGAVAGQNFAGGSASAGAPSSQLMIVTPGGFSSVRILEAYILSMMDPRVDLVSESWGVMPRTGAYAIILDRLVERYGKPIVHAASNAGPFVTSIGDVRDETSHLLTIGASASRPTVQAFFA